MKITVRTERFKNEHGTNPKGYGLWVFSNSKKDWSIGCFGNYSQAKGQAIEQAKLKEISVIYVEA